MDDMIMAIFQPLVKHKFSRAQSQTIVTHFQSSLQAGLSSSTETNFEYNAIAISEHIQIAINTAYGELLFPALALAHPR